MKDKILNILFWILVISVSFLVLSTEVQNEIDIVEFTMMFP